MAERFASHGYSIFISSSSLELHILVFVYIGRCAVCETAHTLAEYRSNFRNVLIEGHEVSYCLLIQDFRYYGRCLRWP